MGAGSALPPLRADRLREAMAAGSAGPGGSGGLWTSVRVVSFMRAPQRMAGAR